MKLFILILISLITFNVHAETWFAVGKVGVNTSYSRKGKCESQEGQKCYNIKGKDPRHYRIGFLMPKVEEAFDCLDEAECDLALSEKRFRCGEGSAQKDDKANWPGLDFAGQEPARPSEGWFMWCQREDLILDPAKKAQADAEDQAKAQEKADRKSKRDARKLKLKECATSNIADFNSTLEKNCIRELARELMRLELSVDDL